MTANDFITNLRALARTDLHIANAMLDAGYQNAYPVSEPARNDLEPVRLEIEEILKGRKITAIKEYRTRTGRGLKESKEAIDAWCIKVSGNIMGPTPATTVAKLNPPQFPDY